MIFNLIQSQYVLYFTIYQQAKNTTWEGGVRVNGLVWSPLIPKERHGKIFDGLMEISDWLPTLYEAAGCFFQDFY